MTPTKAAFQGIIVYAHYLKSFPKGWQHPQIKHCGDRSHHSEINPKSTTAKMADEVKEMVNKKHQII